MEAGCADISAQVQTPKGADLEEHVAQPASHEVVTLQKKLVDPAIDSDAYGLPIAVVDFNR